MDIKTQQRSHVKPGELWYCHNCGYSNVKRKGKKRQRCDNCGQHVWLGRSRLGRLAK